MRQLRQRIGHGPSLEVNQQKADILTGECNRQRQQIGQKAFAFAGAGHARKQSMRSMAVLMGIQIQLTAIHALSDYHTQTVRGIAHLITGGDLKLLHTSTMEKL